jgi:aerobic carbon-monoxide dehydrogenase medium subunit
MIPQSFDYAAPTSLKDALERIAGGGKPLAGGMSLIPMMKLRLAAPEVLVDIGRITELHYIREEGSQLHIGGTTTHYEIESSQLVRSRCPLLAETARHIGDMQVRNLGTIGGSAAHADPAADYPATLMALEVEFRVASARGERRIGVEEFFVDTFTTALGADEIILEVIVPTEPPSTGTSYQKVVQPASGFAIVGAAARIRKSSGKVAWARLGLTGLGPKAYRAKKAEQLIEGTAGVPADIDKAAAVVADGVEASSDIHASAEYRKHLARIYSARAMAAAISSAS